MLKHLFTFVFILFTTSLYSQKINVSGTLYDADGDPAPFVKYYFKKDPNKKYRTGRDGKFSIQMTRGIYDTLKFESISFDDYDLYIGKKWQKKSVKKGGSLYFDITLPDRTWDAVIITPPRPDTVVGTQEYYIEDYEFLPDGKMLLLTYEKTLKKGAVLRLMDEEMEEIDKYYVIGDAVELMADYRGNVHLINKERVYLITITNNEIHGALENRDYYFKYVAPIIDTIGTNIYFSNYSDIYPAFDYFEFNLADSTYNVILQVEDTLMMELYRSEYKYVDVRTKLWAHQKQIETGIDKEIWVGATVFTNSIYYRPLYAPLFKTGEDSIVVFDHYKNKMFRYTPQEGFIDSARISYHLNERKSGWEQPLIQDEETGSVYAIFLRGGYTYLSEIDKTNGSVKKSFKLFYKYVDHIRIIGGKVYYIYRPYESIQRKYLYKEKLA